MYLTDENLLFKNQKVCSFFSPVTSKVADVYKQNVIKAIDAAIADGVRVFQFIGFGGLDDFAYQVVSSKMTKEGLSDIKRILCFPFVDNEYPSNRYFRIKKYEGFDYPCDASEYHKPPYYYRNIALIKRSDWVLFYDYSNCLSREYETALELNKKVVNVKRTGTLNK